MTALRSRSAEHVGPASPPLSRRAAMWIGGALGCLALGALATSLINVAIVLVVAAAVVGLMALFNEPTVVLSMCVFSMWFEGIGPPSLTTGRVVAGVAVATMAVRAMTTSWRPPAFLPWGWVPVGLFITWCWVSGFWSDVHGPFFNSYGQLFLGIAYFLVFASYAESPEQVYRLLRIWVWIGVPIALIGTGLYFTLGGGERVPGLTGGSNNYAVYLTCTVPMVALMIRDAPPRRRLATLALVPTFMAALVTTGSRSGLIESAVMGVYCVTTFPGLDRRRRVRLMVGGLAGILIAGYIAMILNPARFGLGNLTGGADAGAGRLDIWNAGIATFKTHWLFGMGWGQFREHSVEILQKVTGGNLEVAKQVGVKSSGVLDTHNQYLQLGLDVGVIGIALYLLMVASALRNLYTRIRTDWRDLIWAFTGILIAIHVGYMFETQVNQKFMWSIFGIGASFCVRERVTARALRADAHVGMAPIAELAPPPSAAPSGPSVGGSGGSQLARGRDVEDVISPPRGRRREVPRPAPLDLRFRYPLRWVMVFGMIVGIVGSVIVSRVAVGDRYQATANVLAVKMDNPNPRIGIQVVDSQMQTLQRLASSDAYFAELVKESGAHIDPLSLADKVETTRPNLAALIEITLRDTDQQLVHQLGDKLIPALDVTIDRWRSGALGALGQTERDPLPGVDSSYRGPLFLDIYSGVTSYDIAQPPTTYNAVIGAVLGFLITTMITLMAHRRARVSDDEDLEVLLATPLAGRVPRLGFRPRRRLERYVKGFALAVDGRAPDGVRSVAVAGSGIERERVATAMALGVGLAATVDRPVVLVDLDLQRADLSRRARRARRGLRRRPGVSDAAVGRFPVDQLVVKLPLRGIRPALWRIARAHRDRLFVLPAGTVESGSALTHEVGLHEVLDTLAARAIVIVLLPRVPGPEPVHEVLAAVDTTVVVVLNGWSPLDDAVLTVDVVNSAAPGRSGVVLLEN